MHRVAAVGGGDGRVIERRPAVVGEERRRRRALGRSAPPRAVERVEVAVDPHALGRQLDEGGEALHRAFERGHLGVVAEARGPRPHLQAVGPC